MIFLIFSPKNSAKKLAFSTQNNAKLCKILTITLVFEKNANFFAENCRKSQKIVIITSTPGPEANAIIINGPLHTNIHVSFKMFFTPRVPFSQTLITNLNCAQLHHFLVPDPVVQPPLSVGVAAEPYCPDEQRHQGQGSLKSTRKSEIIVISLSKLFLLRSYYNLM
jgi:hypothetical protein